LVSLYLLGGYFFPSEIEKGEETHTIYVGTPPKFCRGSPRPIKKALFGLDSPLLWEKRISVIELITAKDVEERIAYFDQKPANANLGLTIVSILDFMVF
jgi:hypothetical protein